MTHEYEAPSSEPPNGDAINPRRQRRIAARQTQILLAAAQVFAEKGFQRATTKDIAQAADVAEGTIYNYFKSKEELLIGLIEHFASLEAREKYFEEHVDYEAREFFIAHFSERMNTLSPVFMTLVGLLPYLMTDTTMRGYYYQRIIFPAIQMVERHLETRIQHEQFEPLDAAFTARAVVAILIGFQQLWLMEDALTRQYFDKPEWFAGVLADIFISGILKRSE